MHITLRSAGDPDTIVCEGDDRAEAASAVLWVTCPGGEEQATLRDIACYIGQDPDGHDAVYTEWTDDIDRNPRRAGKPANIKHRVETYGGGGVGPFLVVVE